MAHLGILHGSTNAKGSEMTLECELLFSAKTRHFRISTGNESENYVVPFQMNDVMSQVNQSTNRNKIPLSKFTYLMEYVIEAENQEIGNHCEGS